MRPIIGNETIFPPELSHINTKISFITSKSRKKLLPCDIIIVTHKIQLNEFPGIEIKEKGLWWWLWNDSIGTQLKLLRKVNLTKIKL